jgi:hypothetical protein
VVGVRYGPASQRLTVLTDHPPSARSEIRFMCQRNLRFGPTGTSSCRRKPLFFRWITSRSLRNLYESLRTF